MTGEALLRALASAIEHSAPANPADDYFITRKDLVKAIEEAALDVSRSEWEDFMGEDL